ncbi:MAG: UDP-glucose 4-epimerase GalE [Candidatus Promineofilum sp.]|nr:UDP-glucose 4-epimerase GalE [Promineifilum sp.]MBP9657596.1 UDP-glucose 4-epimerase GalE [Promineifilum sp.]
MKLLVTGGAGYIGSHTALELLRAGHDVVVVDNLSNSHEESLRRVEALAGKSLTFHRVDLLDSERLAAVFESEAIDAVIHFAALKAVGESVAQPLRYYRNNITGMLNLLSVMDRHDVRKFVFSSSATVYGDPQEMPITENVPMAPFNPYGRTKAIGEEILLDLCRSDERWAVSILRYFNPIGADPSGTIGEDPNDIPNNLVPYITQVAIGRLPYLSVFGNSYPTPDGTGVRDYIHVVDLALGHLRALSLLGKKTGASIHNLGTGRGYSVLEVVAAFERVIGREIPWRVVAPRPGDAATSYADPSRAEREMGWKAERDLDDMAADSWRWQSQNPNGYRKA